MPTLLHIDSSAFPIEESVSRQVARIFCDSWLDQCPQGAIVYRDLAATPPPHIDAVAQHAGEVDPAQHTPEQAAAFAARMELIEELEAADGVLICAPMYNLSIPSTLKAWIDNVVLMGRTAMGGGTVAGKRVTIIAARGGGYGPGTGREGYDYVQTFLGDLFQVMLRMEVDFIVPELTRAPIDPQMKALVPLYEKARTQADAEACAKARAKASDLAGRLAAAA